MDHGLLCWVKEFYKKKIQQGILKEMASEHKQHWVRNQKEVNCKWKKKLERRKKLD